MNTKAYKPNWLLEYYIPSGGLPCLKTSAHDKGFVWSRQLVNDLIQNSPDSFCDEPLRKWGNCMLWNNYFQITAENTKTDNGFPFSEGAGKNVRSFKGKIIFDSKFH